MFSFMQKKQPEKPKCTWEGELKERRMLGEGSYGDVLLVQDSVRQYFAAKIARNDSIAAKLLQIEYEMYKHLGCLNKNTKGLPQVHAFGYDPRHDDVVLVMKRLGASLRDVMKLNGNSLPAYAVLRIGSQMIRRLEYIHKCGVIHGDIKPRNILCARESFDRIYLVDFGLATFFREGRANILKEMTTGHDFQGTEDFASRHTHRGIAPSRRDDLESLGFTLIYLIKGLLPWTRNLEDEFLMNDEMMQSSHKRKPSHLEILEEKENIPIEVLCEDLPHSIESFMRYVYGLDFYDQPDYSFMMDLFQNGMRDLNDCDDCNNGEELDIWPDPHDKDMFMGCRDEDKLWEEYLQRLAKREKAENEYGEEIHPESELGIEADDMMQVEIPEKHEPLKRERTRGIYSQVAGIAKYWKLIVSDHHQEERSMASERQKGPLIEEMRERKLLFGKFRKVLRSDVSYLRRIYLKREDDSW